MLKHILILSFVTFSLSALPHQNVSIEAPEEQLENAETPESSWNEDEELSILHKKGSRPQVIEIPTKTSLSPN